MTILAVLYIGLLDYPRVELPLRLVTILLPPVIAILFLWHVMRQRMPPLVVERTFIYGGLSAVGLLIHRLFVSPWTTDAGRRTQLDLVAIEWIAMVSIILCVEHLERRMNKRAMQLEGNIISAAARRLGIHRQSLQQKLRSE
jgi:hypothetical protein